MTVVARLEANGIRRLGSSKAGFLYRGANGKPPSRADRERIAKLVIPPAWNQVRISPYSGSAVQAIGLDRAGRWQYLYSERHTRIREERKRRRLLAFLGSLPTIRTRVARDLRGDGLGRERVLAAMVRLLLRGFLRPGSAVYTRENGTYGLSTLRHRHARVAGRRITLSYVGKGGQPQVRRVADAASARVVSRLLAEPGSSLFRFLGPDGEWTRARARHVNQYLREITGARFTAKDFRTWAGTLFGACALARQGYPEPATRRALRRCVAAAMRETSDLLGNTPAVCRSSYVSPAVLAGFARGRVLAEAPTLEALERASPRVLAGIEARLSRLIREGSPVRPAPAAATARRASVPDSLRARRAA